jgi:hypothetical protein
VTHFHDLRLHDGEGDAVAAHAAIVTGRQR